MTELYAVLELKKGCSDEAIKKAYKKLALKWHPDKNTSPEATERFKAISEAYAILSNPEQRCVYDQHGMEGLKQSQQHSQQHHTAPTNIFDMFPGMFSGAFPGGFPGTTRAKPTKGNNVQFTLTVTLREAFNGCIRRVKVVRDVICEPCHGSGIHTSSLLTSTQCPVCKGQGARMEARQIAPGFIAQQQVQCGKCHGSGDFIPDGDRCARCSGRKVVKEEATLEVALEPGVKNGAVVTLTERSDQYPGRVPGDIVITVVVQPESDGFVIEGSSDLVYRKALPLRDALTGFEFVIDHLDGRKLMFKNDRDIVVPQMRLTVPKEGMPNGPGGSKGDLHVVFDVAFPTNLDPERKHALRHLLAI